MCVCMWCVMARCGEATAPDDLPYPTIRDLLRHRAPDFLAADAEAPAMEAVHDRGQLRLLRLRGLAFCLPAGGLHALEPDDGRRDRATALRRAPSFGAAHPGHRRRPGAFGLVQILW